MTAYKGPYPGASAGQDASPDTHQWERREVKWWHWVVDPLRAYRPWRRAIRWGPMLGIISTGQRGRTILAYEYQSDRKRAWEALREAHDPTFEGVQQASQQASQAPQRRRPMP